MLSALVDLHPVSGDAPDTQVVGDRQAGPVEGTVDAGSRGVPLAIDGHADHGQVVDRHHSPGDAKADHVEGGVSAYARDRNELEQVSEQAVEVGVQPGQRGAQKRPPSTDST